MKSIKEVIKNKKPTYAIFIADAVLGFILLLALIAPGKPEDVKGLKTVSSTFSSVVLEWEKSDGANGYKVYRAEDNKEFKYIESTVKNEFKDDNLRTGKKYRYAVVARNGIKEAANKSKSISVVTELDTPKLSVETKTGAIELNISKIDGAVKYEVTRDGKKIGESSETKFVDKDADTDVKHSYTVKAVRYVKDPVFSKASNNVEAELHAIPNFEMNADDQTITFEWEDSEYYDDYKLYMGDQLLTETDDTSYVLDEYDIDKIYDVKIVGTNTETKYMSPAISKRIKVMEEPMDNEGARNAACEWGVMIANDNSFAYGTGQTAHRTGCYFCGTNTRKKGPGYEKTYCCNPFVHACYAHGARDPQMLATCQRGGSVGMSSSDYTRYGNWTNIGKPSIPELERGDVLVSGGHVMLYIGDGELVHAATEGWGANTITVSNCSSFYGMVSFVMRYQGNGDGTMYKVREVDKNGNVIKNDTEETQESQQEEA